MELPAHSHEHPRAFALPLFWNNRCAHKSEHTNCAAWPFPPCSAGTVGALWRGGWQKNLPRTLSKIPCWRQASSLVGAETDCQHLSVRPLARMWPSTSPKWALVTVWASENFPICNRWPREAAARGHFLWCLGSWPSPPCPGEKMIEPSLLNPQRLMNRKLTKSHFLSGCWKKWADFDILKRVLEFCCKCHLRFFKKYFPVYRGKHSLHKMKKKLSQVWNKLIDFRLSYQIWTDIIGLQQIYPLQIFYFNLLVTSQNCRLYCSPGCSGKSTIVELLNRCATRVFSFPFLNPRIMTLQHHVAKRAMIW